MADLEAMKEIMLSMIDESLGRHLADVKSKLSEVLTSLDDAHIEIGSLKSNFQELPSVKKHIAQQDVMMIDLKKENKQLKEQILNMEYQERRDNLQFIGYEEKKDEDPEKVVRDTLSAAGIDLTDRSIVRAHRIGKFDQKRKRPILVKFSHWKDRDMIWKMKEDIRMQSHIKIIEDLPKEMAARKRVLLPVMFAARNEKEELTGVPKNRVSLNRDKLILNGEVITVDSLDKLPKHLHPESIYTPSKGNMVAFFTVHSPLSNHYPSPFELDGMTFNCNEQYVMYKKAIKFGDNATAQKIMEEKSPAVQKELGKRVANFNKNVWESVQEVIFVRGLRAKFAQNPHCAAVLRATGDKRIYEASPYDGIYGVGLSVFSKDIWDESKHKGLNWMGAWLEMVRSEVMKS